MNVLSKYTILYSYLAHNISIIVQRLFVFPAITKGPKMTTVSLPGKYHSGREMHVDLILTTGIVRICCRKSDRQNNFGTKKVDKGTKKQNVTAKLR